jgi:hypothetical protein
MSESWSPSFWEVEKPEGKQVMKALRWYLGVEGSREGADEGMGVVTGGGLGVGVGRRKRKSVSMCEPIKRRASEGLGGCRGRVSAVMWFCKPESESVNRVGWRRGR